MREHLLWEMRPIHSADMHSRHPFALPQMSRGAPREAKA